MTTPKYKRFVIQYSEPRVGFYGTRRGVDWRLVESNSERKIRRLAIMVDVHVKLGTVGWESGTGHYGGYYDRTTKQFIRIQPPEKGVSA